MIYLLPEAHLGARVRKALPVLENDSYLAMNRLAVGVLEHAAMNPGPHHAIFAGDTFNYARANGPELEAFKNFMDQLKGVLTVWAVAGNHEGNALPVVYTEGAHQLVDEHLLMSGPRCVHVCGLSYMPSTKLHKAMETVPECDLLVLHAAFEHLLGFEGVYDLSISDVPSRVKHIVAGDVHIPELKHLPDNRWFLSPGPMHPCNIRQSKPCGFWAWDGLENIEFVDIGSRPIFRVECRTAHSVSVLRTWIAGMEDSEDGDTEFLPLVEVRYDHQFGEDLDRLSEQFEQRVVLLPVPLPGVLGEDQGGDVVDDDVDLSSVNMLTELPTVVDREASSEVFDLAKTLIDNDPRTVVREYLVKGGLG